MATGNDLAIAYVQLLPSFDKFFAKARADFQKNTSEFERYGRTAGQAWAKGFGQSAKGSPTAAAPSSGGGSGASTAATAAAAGLAADVGAELGATEAAALGAGTRVGASFAQGLTRSGAAISAAGTGLTTAVTVPLVAVGALATRSAVQFESAFAGVRKTVDATEQEFGRLEQGIRDLAKEIPATREEIARVTELGGQFGIPNQDLLGFTRTVVDLGVATNLTSEEGALLLSQFANITGLPTDEFDRLGATIVDLGNNLSTTEDRIAQFALRLGGQGSIIGLTQDQILGFSAALASVGIMPEAGGTAFSRVFQRISDAVETGNEDLQTFADTTGLTADAFRELYESDPAALINEFVKGLSTVAASGATTPLLDELELVDVRIRDSLQRLAGSEDLLGKSLGIASTAWAENTALVEEAERRYATTESQLQIFQNRIGDIGVSLGEALLPAINQLLDGLQPVIDTVQNAAEWFGRLPEPIQQAAITLTAVAAVSGPIAAVTGRVVTALGGIATNSSLAATGMSRYTSATVAATAATEAYNRAAASRPGGYIPTGTVKPPAAPGGPPTTLIAGQAATTLAIYAAGTAAAAGAVNQFSGASDKQEQAINGVVAALGRGEGALEEFRALAETRTANWNPLDGFFNPDFIRGELEIDGVEIAFRDVDRAIEQVGQRGPEALQELRRQLIEQRSEVASNTEAWEDLSYAIRQTRVEEGIDPNPGGATRGEATGGAIADTQEANRRALEGADGALRNYAATAAPAANTNEGFAQSVKRMNAELKLASVGFDSSAAAANRYRAAVEAAGADDNILSAGLAFSDSFRTFREQAGLQQSEEDRKAQAREIAVEQDRIATALRDSALETDNFADAVKRLNPQLAALDVAAESAAAAGNAFRESIERSSSLDDIAGSAVSLGEAYKTARKSIRGLPAELDLAAVSLGKLRPRQQRAVQGILSLGEATTDYLAKLIEAGRTDAEVAGEASRLRDEYVKTFRQLGFNEDQIRRYLEAMGLTPEQVSTAIKVSGLEEARAKFEAYASLLEGKIPGSVASSVIATIEAGDFEGAAAQLARFAATNPIDLPVGVEIDQPAITAAQDALDELEKDILDLPDAYDAVTATFGGYTEDQERGLNGLIQLGDKAQDVIAELIAANDYDGARESADRFREKFRELLGDFGIVGGAAEDYIDNLLQLSEIDVETNIRLSGIEQAITKIGLYQDILTAAGEGIPKEVLDLLAENLASNNFEGVAVILEQFAAGVFGFEIPGLQIPAEVDTTKAASDIGTFYRQTETGEFVAIPAGAATQLAEEGVRIFRRDEEGKPPVPLQIGVNTQPAVTGVQVFRDFVANNPATIDVYANFRDEVLGAFPIFGQRGRSSGVLLPGMPGYGGIDGNPVTPFAVGGFVSGDGGPTADRVPAMLSAGEYVVRASAVRSLGLDFLDKVNKGYVPGFAMGGLVEPAPAPSGIGSGVNVDYTVVEAKSRPKPEDLVRVTNSALFLGTM